MQGQEFVDLLNEYVRPEVALDEGDLLVACRLAHALSYVQNRRMERILRVERDMPMLYSYQNDGWGSFVTSYQIRKGGGTFLRAAGRTKAEFCLERACIRARKMSRVPSWTWLISWPRSMTLGRGFCFQLTAIRLGLFGAWATQAFRWRRISSMA